MKFINQSFAEVEELGKFQSSTFDSIARRKLIEDQNTILALSGRIQELQNEVNCVNDSKDFQDTESIRSGNSHVTSRPMSFPPHPIPEGMLRHSLGIFSYTPEPHIAFCPIFVHPLFPVFEPHIQKWVIFVRRRPCVYDTVSFESLPPPRKKRSNLATTTIELPECQERRGAKTI